MATRKYEPYMGLGVVYLYHFDQPISPRHTCQHYIGWCLDLVARDKMHRAGNGARLMQVALERGIGFTIVRRWEGGRELERRLKARHESPRLCPVCSPGSPSVGGDLVF